MLLNACQYLSYHCLYVLGGKEKVQFQLKHCLLMPPEPNTRTQNSLFCSFYMVLELIFKKTPMSRRPLNS